MRITLTVETTLSPERVRSALLDFSERRPALWPGLDPKVYQVHEVGDTWALVTEGNKSPKIWARERYDWSKPDVVSWTVEESNFCKPGSRVMATIAPGANGGSRVDIDWERKPTGFTGVLMIGMMGLMGKSVLRTAMKKSFENIARLDAGGN